MECAHRGVSGYGTDLNPFAVYLANTKLLALSTPVDALRTILQLITTKIGKLGENISVKRFARFKVGDAGETIAISKPEQKPE